MYHYGKDYSNSLKGAGNGGDFFPSTFEPADNNAVFIKAARKNPGFAELIGHPFYQETMNNLSQVMGLPVEKYVQLTIDRARRDNPDRDDWEVAQQEKQNFDNIAVKFAKGELDEEPQHLYNSLQKAGDRMGNAMESLINDNSLAGQLEEAVYGESSPAVKKRNSFPAVPKSREVDTPFIQQSSMPDVGSGFTAFGGMMGMPFQQTGQPVPGVPMENDFVERVTPEEAREFEKYVYTKTNGLPLPEPKWQRPAYPGRGVNNSAEYLPDVPSLQNQGTGLQYLSSSPSQQGANSPVQSGGLTLGYPMRQRLDEKVNRFMKEKYGLDLDGVNQFGNEREGLNYEESSMKLVKKSNNTKKKAGQKPKEPRFHSDDPESNVDLIYERKRILEMLNENKDNIHITKTMTKLACLGSAKVVYNKLKRMNLKYYEPIIVWTGRKANIHTNVMLVPKSYLKKYKAYDGFGNKKTMINNSKSNRDGIVQVDRYLVNLPFGNVNGIWYRYDPDTELDAMDKKFEKIK